MLLFGINIEVVIKFAFQVSKLGFGCMGLSGIYNDPIPEEVGISIIKDSFSKGITFFDTADVYGANANEVLVGKVNASVNNVYVLS